MPTQSMKLPNILAELVSSALPLFHDAPPMHVHRRCKNCEKASRCEDLELQKCKGCYCVHYCSKSCQQAHWSSHKGFCKYHSDFRRDVTRATNNPQAWTDLCSWMEYHHNSLMNAAAASFKLRENPGAEEHFAFFVSIRYDSKPGQPMQKRFSFMDARAVDMRTHIPAIDAMTMPDTSLETKAAKEQLGRFYAGTGTYCIAAVFDTMLVNMTPHKFVIDRPVSRAKRHPEWYALLRDYITQGRKMRFCCRKIAAGTCCCGGWTHPSAVNQAHVENVQVAESHASIEEVSVTESI